MRRSSVVLSTLVLIAFPLAAQGGLTVDRIWGTGDFNSDLVAVQWMPVGGAYTALETDDHGAVLYRLNPATGARTVLLRSSDLVTPAGDTVVIESYEFSRDGNRILIFTNVERGFRRSTYGDYWVWDLSSRRLMPVGQAGGRQQYAKFSPDANLVGYVRDHDLYVTDLRTGTETRITRDGSDDIINGTTDWVYEEELSLVDAFRISPDNRHIAFWRLDQSPIRRFHLIDQTTLYPELNDVRYPKAGTANSTVRIGVADIASGATQWMDLGRNPDIYIAAMNWIDDSALWMTRFNRHQNVLDVLIGNPATGVTRVAVHETDSAYVSRTEPRWLAGGNEFLWESERDGYAQVYLYRRDGTLERRVTPGGYDVTAVNGVDAQGRVLYFTGASDGPLGRQFFRVGLDGRNLRQLTTGAGWHNVSLDPAFHWFVDQHSTMASPPDQTLYQASGRRVRVLADNAALKRRVDSLGLRAPEFVTIPAADGTPLNAWIIRPPDYDPHQRYPVLLYVYGGPGSQTVMDTWGGQRYLWHQMLATQGYIVASVDNRGTGARGRAFKKMTYLRLGQLESADQIAAARWFAHQAWVDPDRVGIWGWSYGGYMSSLSLFTSGGAFSAGIAVAPVTDWRYYDTIYTERFMRTPQENPEGYDMGAPLAHVGELSGRFLLVHGTGDDNVNFQNSIMLIQALENANKQFDMRIYPNKTHSIAGRATRINLYQLLTDWVKGNL